MAKKKSGWVYAVRKGRVPGIYTSYDECKLHVDGFTGAEHKSFPTREQAQAWLNAGAPAQQAQQLRFPNPQQTSTVRYSSLHEGIPMGLYATTMRMNPAPKEEYRGSSFATQRTLPIVNNVSGFTEDNLMKRKDSMQQTQWRSGVIGEADQAEGQCNTPQKLGIGQNPYSLKEHSEGLPQRPVGDRKKQKKNCSNLFIFRHNPHDPERVRANMISPTAVDPCQPSSSASSISISPSSAPLDPDTVQANMGSPAPGRGTSWPSTAIIQPSPATLLGPERETSTRLPEYVRDTTALQGIYTVEYDGASKGNPGPAGAGALIRDPTGAVVREIMVGLGEATNNVAEYRGLIAGLKVACAMGVQHLAVQGDSDLVCKQVKRIYKVNKLHLMPLCDEARSLMWRFRSCDIKHVPRAFNSKADELANRGVNLPVGFEQVIPI